MAPWFTTNADVDTRAHFSTLLGTRASGLLTVRITRGRGRGYGSTQLAYRSLQ